MNYPLYLVLFGDLPYMLAFEPSALREGVIGETVGFPIP